jgi:protein-L-isoaspartate(D-aspartate) O-methyltransferase
MTDFTAARINMVENQVRCNSVTDARLIAAMAELPRERFVPEERRSVAYMDQDVRIADGARPRYLLHARVLAKLAQLAEIRDSDLVLDVGCGTGYSTAVLARLARSVIGLEEEPALARAASETLNSLGIANATVVTGALREGFANQAPYDVIFLNGSAPEAPAGLLAQLAEGGRLVAVIGSGPAAQASIFVRTNGAIGAREAFDASAHPLPGFELAETFMF